MKLKSDKLHFEINPSRNKPIGYIRNSYREGGKVKHQTVGKINGVPLEKLQEMKAAFDGKPFSGDDIKISGGREYGASAALHALAKKIALDKTLYSRNEPWVGSALAMIIGRIVYQGSKLALSRVADISCLWEVCGVGGEIDVDKHCYDAMDELLPRQKKIQKKLAGMHLGDGTVILYDITGSYFEGEYDDKDMAAYGYNRDKKRGKKQIVIGLVCTKEGCPVAVEVFPGNTAGCTTVAGKIDEIKNAYGISDFVFVGGRGMLTQKNIDACPGTSTVTGLTHAGMKKLCEHEAVQFSFFDEDVGTEVVLPEEPGTRFILRKNPALRAEERATRIAIIEKTEAMLKAIAAPKKKTDDKTLAARATKIFQRYKTEKYFSWDIVDAKIHFSRQEQTIAGHERYDGLYVIKSNVTKELMDKREIVEAYKSLINVEMAFRDMKTVQLEIRPVCHRTEERIKAHVFICMLSYYLLWNMNASLKELYQEDAKKYTHSHVIELMKSQQKLLMEVGDPGIQSHVIANPAPVQERIQTMLLGAVL